MVHSMDDELQVHGAKEPKRNRAYCPDDSISRSLTTAAGAALPAPAPPFLGRLRPHCTLTSWLSTLSPTLHRAAASSAASRLVKLTKLTLLDETSTTDLILLAGMPAPDVSASRIESSEAVAGSEVRKSEVCGRAESSSA